MNRWRFVNDAAGVPRDERVIEVEVEPTGGFFLHNGEGWEGLHVKARYPLKRDRRWRRGNLVGPVEGDESEAVRLVAMELLAT